MLTFPDFMDISYALALEDRARVNPLSGLEELAEKIVPAQSKREVIPTQAEVKDKNEQARAELMARMAGVQGIKPQKKPRRAK